MFRAPVLRRSFSLFTRVPTARIVQSAARHGHQSVTIHRVRIRRPFLSRQRLVGALAIATATYGLGQYLGLEVDVEEEEVEEERKPGRWKKQVRNDDGTLDQVDDQDANDDQDDGEDDDDEEEEYDDAILFLPTGFSRPKPMTFYRGSDPEWQEFKKIAQDKPRIERMRQELVSLVRRSCTSPQYVAKIGEVDHNKGQVWMELKFPDGPPPEYERPGYELTEDLEWRKTTRDVEALHHHKLRKAFYPTAAAAALYQDTKKKAERSWNNVAAYMGWAEKTEHPTVQQMMQQVGTSSPPTSPAAPAATAASASPLGASLPGPTQQPAGQPSPPAAGSGKEVAFALPDAKALTLDLGQFRQDFQKANKSHFLHVPRGALRVNALIQVCGTKARLTMNVTAIYDPKTGRYVDVHAHFWHYMPYRQSPRGGP